MYTDIENVTLNRGTDDEEIIVNWRIRRRKLQLRCPKCDRFFDVPSDINFDIDGYASASIYHFCEDIYPDEANNEGWTVLPHIVDWGVQ